MHKDTKYLFKILTEKEEELKQIKQFNKLLFSILIGLSVIIITIGDKL